MMALPAEKLSCCGRVNPQEKIKIMGDKSPKANSKKSGQKQSAANSASAKKGAAMVAKSAVGKKK